MMPEEERAWVLSHRVGESSDYPSACLQELFAEQVRVRPEAVALISGTERLLIVASTSAPIKLRDF